MYRTSYTAARILMLALALGLMARDEALAAAPLQPAGGDRASAPCPTPSAIETAIGFPVTVHPMIADRCMYELAGQYKGAFVTLSYQPATRADDLFAQIRQRVKGLKGVNAQPERVGLGEGGWGYGGMGHKEAATVAQGRLYHVEMEYDLHEDLKLPDDAAVRVIEIAMRDAPSNPASASLDACTLATNAEVAQVAEESPEFAKFWSAPEASFQGSHCDYDGGSIRLYQGNAPAALEATLKAFKADKQPRVPVSGIGDKAFFMIPVPDNKYQRVGLLAVYAGPRVVQLTLDARGDEPIEATRPRLERFARLVLPRLR